MQLYKTPTVEDCDRLNNWIQTLRGSPDETFGETVLRVAILAVGIRARGGTGDEYLTAGGSPDVEPISVSLQSFVCVSFIETCLAVARLANRQGPVTWQDFAREVELLRYRDGVCCGYLSRLHYFSEWIWDNGRRGNVKDLGRDMGTADLRPLRYVTQNATKYPALGDPNIVSAFSTYERKLDAIPRWVIPLDKIAECQDRILSGDIIAIARSKNDGLDVSHVGIAYRDNSGTLVEVSARASIGNVVINNLNLSDFVLSFGEYAGILIVRPLPRAAQVTNGRQKYDLAKIK